jgi:transposase
MPTEERFAPLYSERGRGAISPLLLALVTVFQMLEKVPDRAAARYVVTRFDWKYALHLPLGYTGFHFTDLSAFRERLLQHGQERWLFDYLIEQLKARGLLKARGKVRTDATHVVALMNRLSQLELVRESLRTTLEALDEVAPDWVSEMVPEAFSESYAQRQNDYRLSERQIMEQLRRAGHDGYWLLAQIDRGASAVVRALSEVQVLRTVLEQQFPQGPEQGPTAKRPGGRGVIETPHEPQVRGGKKGSKSWLGYKAQVTESCDEELPPLIVDVEATEAMEYDGAALPAVQERLAQRGLRPTEQYVDQNYTSGENLAHSAQQGIRLMGRPQEDHGAPEGYRQADFQIDEERREARCPHGQRNVVWSEQPAGEGLLPRVQIRFAGSTCRACPAFGQCTRSPQGRAVVLNPYRAWIRAGREQARTEAFRLAFRRRSPIEGTLSELVRGHGLRFSRYRGLAPDLVGGWPSCASKPASRPWP